MTARLALVASTLALLAASPSTAMSKGAAYLVKERIAAVCPHGGTFAPKGITERDLTGDGRADLVLDLAGLTCRGAANGLNDESGAAHCPVAFYVRKGDVLVLVSEVASIGARVGPGNPPRITLVGFEYQEHSVRWNGRDFQ